MQIRCSSVPTWCSLVTPLVKLLPQYLFALQQMCVSVDASIRNATCMSGPWHTSHYTGNRDSSFRVGRPWGHFHGEYRSERCVTTRFISKRVSAHPIMMLERQARLASIARTLRSKREVVC